MTVLVKLAFSMSVYYSFTLPTYVCRPAYMHMWSLTFSSKPGDLGRSIIIRTSSLSLIIEKKLLHLRQHQTASDLRLLG